MEKYKYCNIGRARELSSRGREGGREEKVREAGEGVDCIEGRDDARKRGYFLRGDTGMLRSDKNRERTAYTCIMYI